MLNEISYCLNSTLNHGGFSSYRLVLGSNPVELFSWDCNDHDRDFVQNTLVSSQFTLQRKLRVTAQQAMLRGMANGNLGSFVDRNRTFNTSDIAIGDTVIVERVPRNGGAQSLF